MYAMEAFLVSASPTAARRKFKEHFNMSHIKETPNIRQIRKWLATEETLKRVSESILSKPGIPLRTRAIQLGICKSQLHEVMKKILKLHPYFMQAQVNWETDYESRISCVEFLLKTFENGRQFRNIFYSNEAEFYLTGCVKRDNFYYVDSVKSELDLPPLNSERVTVWCAMSGNEIVGPYFFENDGGTVTVDSNRYCEMLNGFFRKELSNNAFFNGGYAWFQQDSTPGHDEVESMKIVKDLFPGRTICQSGDIPWAERSPDLNPCDFFLWGYLKGMVYKDPPETIGELKEKIRSAISSISSELCNRVFQMLQTRIDICHEANGEYCDDVIFVT